MWDAAILSVVAALVLMIPQGLMLLTSTVLAIATTRLGAKNVLVQQSYSRRDACMRRYGLPRQDRHHHFGQDGAHGAPAAWRT